MGGSTPPAAGRSFKMPFLRRDGETWHLVEHSLLQVQAIAGQNLFGSPVPTSVLQQFVPRPELHLLYNLAVFVPMVVAMRLHTRSVQARVNACTCADAPAGAKQAGLAA